MMVFCPVCDCKVEHDAVPDGDGFLVHCPNTGEPMRALPRGELALQMHEAIERDFGGPEGLLVAVEAHGKDGG